MSKNSTSIESDDFDEYPEITEADLNKATHRRNFQKIPAQQSINLTLDADIIAWLKTKTDDDKYRLLINSALREIMLHNS